MKKIYFFSAIGLAAFLSFSLVFFSCNKNLQNNIAGRAAPFSTTDTLNNGQCPYNCHDIRCKQYLTGYCGPGLPLADTVVVVTNSNNPMESAGSIHNQGIIQIVSGLTGNETYPQLFVLSENYLTSVGLDITGLDQELNNEYQAGYFSMSPDSVPTALYQAGMIDARTGNYLTQLNTAVHTYYDLNSTSASNYNSFAYNLIAIENAVASDNSITADERSLVEGAAAVGRYSAALWQNGFVISTGLVTPSATEPTGGPGGLWAWLKRHFSTKGFSIGKTLQGDIEGAAKGYASKVGSGSSPSQYNGAGAGGAASGSAGAAIQQIVHL